PRESRDLVQPPADPSRRRAPGVAISYPDCFAQSRVDEPRQKPLRLQSLEERNEYGESKKNDEDTEGKQNEYGENTENDGEETEREEWGGRKGEQKEEESEDGTPSESDDDNVSRRY
ncbi:unnamed protein product, partial [Sphacelaria rigidula]